jgi:hypothetical protein
MALISDVLGIVIAIAIFIFLVLLFYKLGGSPECDKLATATAEDLRISIDKVYLEDKISPYYGQGIPPDDAKNQFDVVPIKLCQKPSGALGVLGFFRIPTGTGAALSAEIPDYILTYEIFPESGAFSPWTESKPFEAGAVNSFLTYAAIRWGPKLILNLGKYLAKAPGWLLKESLQIPLIGGKIANFISEHLDNRVVRWLLRSAFGSSSGETIALNIPERFIADFYGEEFKTTIENLRYMVLEKNVDEIDAMANLGLLESEWDDAAGKYVPIATEKLTGKGLGVVKEEMYVVNPEFRKLFKTYIELAPSDEVRSLYEKTFYIPSWGSRFGTEIVKQEWYGFEYSMLNNRFTDWFSYDVIQPTKDLYNDFKNGLRKAFGLNTVNRFDTAAEAAAYKEWAFVNFDQFRSYVLDNENFYSMGFQQALEDVSGKILSDPSWVSDEDLFKFLIQYDR